MIELSGNTLVTPAKAGVQGRRHAGRPWIPAFAGMTIPLKMTGLLHRQPQIESIRLLLLHLQRNNSKPSRFGCSARQKSTTDQELGGAHRICRRRRNS
jgi:hypothetical protein